MQIMTMNITRNMHKQLCRIKPIEILCRIMYQKLCKIQYTSWLLVIPAEFYTPIFTRALLLALYYFHTRLHTYASQICYHPGKNFLSSHGQSVNGFFATTLLTPQSFHWAIMLIRFLPRKSESVVISLSK